MFRVDSSHADLIVTLLLVLAAASPTARAQCELQKLTASDASPGDEFAYSMAADGEVAVVGAISGDREGVPNSGSAYVLRRTGIEWAQETELTATDGVAGDEFGVSVAIHQDLIVVGARDDSEVANDAGAAYVFRRSAGVWEEEDKLIALDPASFDHFGTTVAVQNDVAVVGSPDDDDDGSRSGSVYVFRYNGVDWDQEQKLTAADAGAMDRFGWSVAIDGNTILIGALQDDDVFNDSGSAYVFVYNGAVWEQQAKLNPTDPAAIAQFGRSVSIDADGALVGAWQDDDTGFFTGSAYVFRRSGTVWAQEDKIVADDAADFRWFGYAVSLRGDVALVGAFGDGDGGSEAGAAYLFRRDGSDWPQDSKLTAGDPAANDRLGWSAALTADAALVGAYHDDDGGGDSGSVYVFGIGGDCNDNGFPDACDIAEGTSLDADENGIPDECETSVPTVARWGLWIMAMGMLSVGTIVLGRRRGALFF